MEALYKEAGLNLSGCKRIFNIAGFGGAVGELNFGMLEAGDHVVFKNYNSFDKRGNHSGVFVKWIDQSNGVAEMVSYSGGASGKVNKHSTNFNEQPIQRIRRPSLSAKIS